ncbi:YicC/YloC family endoribonuclease [Mesobacterium pallidum]|uniref:YicC/YloC family endoribonuclease n=1 Tax=Mesobacterium pallidum TaxID=2872037 RepID=UPI001EE2603D|nr:YicC/YloC family endoribonuclease [Mesobacterium pallidum]
MIHSMTGFASGRGQEDGINWALDLRGVNAKGLDLRLRVPDWIDGLEPRIRKLLGTKLQRGSVQLSLRVARDEGEQALRLSESVTGSVLTALERIESMAAELGLALTPASAADILGQRGVLESVGVEDHGPELADTLVAGVEAALDEFIAMRATEGAMLAEVLNDQLAQVASLTDQAATEAEARLGDMAAALKRNLARVLDNSDGADPDRVAQELAMIAVKADVTEEIDRLRGHVTAARDLLAQGGAVGRKLDFLMQEFNREANTICSKAQGRGLTNVGLELKAVIDQMREQVQNVE